ncbi:DNA primase [Streptomyces albidoflavus]|uniref:bifunctional DNA primase/polymerase n=1 Tax=Streptomyces albidoflavus TaxID=1886 RepID=UPI000775A4FC|nr:bifunctional DNA primase/polymerase [Streptomyces albidoflavus]AMM11222.1 DNA primase [Streptomyces albidoflavus]
MSALLSAALTAAERGWPVFPLRPGGKRPALHPETRCPRTGACAGGHVTWERRATTDPDRIRAAWTTGDWNIGLATGPARLVVVDLDKPKNETDAPDGAANLLALCERAGQPVPTTRTVRTASGGAHLYFSAPDGTHLRNTAGALGSLIDTRAHGGYVLAPGSIIDGRRYRVKGPALIRPLPGWLLERLAPPHPSTGAVAPVFPLLRAGGRLATVVLDRETARARQAPEGSRNATLLACVRAVGRFVAWGDLDRTHVETAFQGAGEAAGLPPAEVSATIRSALDWSIRTARPRSAA